MVEKTQCSKCKNLLVIKQFSKNKSRKSGLNGECKICNLAYRSKNKDKISALNKDYKLKNKVSILEKRNKYNKDRRVYISSKLKERKLKNQYGITIHDYNLMLGLQEGLCAICDKQNSIERPLNVDHCHKTNKVRGLLCGSCNRGLGLFKDSVELLERSINYLKENE